MRDGRRGHPEVGARVERLGDEDVDDGLGVVEERLDVAEGTTLAALREALAGRGLAMAKVIGVSSYLVNSLSTPPDSLTPLAEGARVDVLPPFAGG